MESSHVGSARDSGAADSLPAGMSEAHERIAAVFSFTLDAVASVSRRSALCFEAALLACERGEWAKVHRVGDTVLALRASEGKSLFVTLAQRGDLKAIQELLERFGEKISDAERTQAFHEACAQGWLELISLLHESVFVDAPLKRKTALFSAIDFGQAEVVVALLKLGAARTARFEEEGLTFTPAAYAIRRGELECLIPLLQSSTAYRQRVTGIGTLLHVAVHFGQSHIVAHLLIGDRGQRLIREVNDRQQTPVGLAAYLDDTHAISLMRDHVTESDDKGLTPLHWAAKGHSHAAIHLLCRFGASLTTRDPKGRTPADLAEGSTLDLVRYLERKERVADRRPPNFLVRAPQNLVLPGGDLWSYVGSLEVLQERRCLGEVRRIAGMSNGAYLALLLALGCPLSDCRDKLTSWSKNKELSEPCASKINALAIRLDGVKFSRTGLSVLLEKEPVLPSRRLDDLEALIWEKTGIENCTLGELRALAAPGSKFKELHLVGRQQKTGDVVNFDPKNHLWRNLLVSDAVAVCLLSPGLRPPRTLRFRNERGKVIHRCDLGGFVDASLAHTRLLETFDHGRYLGRRQQQPVFNGRTVGLRSRNAVVPDRSSELFAHIYHGLQTLAGDSSEHRLVLISGSSLDPALQLAAGRQAARRFLPDQVAATLANLPRVQINEKSVPAMYSHFTGREGLLDELSEQLTKIPKRGRKRRVLVGPPGRGKSELACAFANREFDSFSVIYWVPSETKELRDLAYRDLAKRLKVRLDPADSMEVVRRAVFRKLEQLDRPYLLIYDNVEGTIAYPQRGGAVLITSQKADLWDESECVALPEFSLKEASKLYTSITHEEPRGIHKLIEELGSDPFIIDQTSGYISKKGLTIDEYLKELVDPLELSDFMEAEGLRYGELDSFGDGKELARGKSLRRAWCLCFRNLSERAFGWLRLSSHLAPENIPESFVEAWLQRESKITPLEARIQARHLRQELCDYSLIRYSGRSKQLRLHRLLPLMLHGLADDPVEEGMRAVDFALGCLASLDEWDPSGWTSARDWLPHLYWLLRQDFLGADLSKQWALLSKISSIEEINGSPLARHKAAERAFLIAHKYNAGSPSVELAGAYKVSGLALSAIGRFEEALARQIEGLKLLEASGKGKTSAEYALLLSDAGNSLWGLGRFDEALERHRQAADICSDRSSGLSRFQCVAIFSNMGTALQSSGQLDEALDCYARAADKLRASDRTGVNLMVANLLMNKANVLSSLGKLQDALRCFEEAHGILQALHAEAPHTDIATVLNNMGNLSQRMGKLEEALDRYTEALRIQGVIYGDEPALGVATSIVNRGSVLLGLGRHVEVLAASERGLAMQSRIYGEGPHPEKAGPFNIRGLAYQALGKLDDALEAFQTALRMLGPLEDRDPHPTRATLLNNVGLVLLTAGRNREALDTFEQVLEMAESLYRGEPHPEVARLHLNTAGALFPLGRKEEALTHLGQAIDAQRAVYSGEPHPDLAMSLFNKGTLLYSMGRYDEAIPALEEAEALAKETMGEGHATTKEMHKYLNVSKFFRFFGGFFGSW